MEVDVNETISISAKKLVESMTIEELGVFCSELAEKVNKDFTERNIAAKNFADGLSENGCRFLAEVVTHHFIRNSQTGFDT